MSPAALAWLHRGAVLVHLGGVVVWMGAVAYYLLVLRPAMRDAGLARPERYALLVAVKGRLPRVVGAALAAIVGSGLVMAQLRGLLPGGGASAFARRVFALKLVVVAALVLIFLFALPLLKRVREPARRGRLFNLTHVVVLVLGALAAAGGVVLGR